MSNSTFQQVIAIIPAAGVGARMAETIPKQYLKCAGKPVIWHSLNLMQRCHWISRIYVALSPNDPYWDDEIGSQFSKVEIVTGGESRAESVTNALSEAMKTQSDNIWAMVHDAARPCLSINDLELIENYLSDSPEYGMILADKLHDTIKQDDGNDHTEITVDRSHLWRALTPQVFRLGELSQAYDSDRLNEITDEASAMEMAGYKTRLVQGDARNIKVTRPADLVLADLYIGQMENDPCE